MNFHTTYKPALWQKLAKLKPSLLSLLFPFLLNRYIKENIHLVRKLIPPCPSLHHKIFKIKHKAQIPLLRFRNSCTFYTIDSVHSI